MKLVSVVAVSIAWYCGILAFVAFPPAIAAGAMVLATGLFVWRYLVRQPRQDQARWSYRNEIGLNEVRSPGRVAVAIGAFLITLIPLGELLGRYVSVPEPPILARLHSPGGWMVYLVILTVVAPIFEEFIFRGVIQHVLEVRLGPVVSIALTAALFALAHGEFPALPIRYAFGLLVGTLALQSGSLWSCIAAHAALNAAVTVISLGFGDRVPVLSGLSSSGVGLISVVGALASVTVLSAFDTRLRREVSSFAL